MNKQLNELRQALIERFMSDLDDDERSNPNLYKVIRDFLRDYEGDLDSLPKGALNGLEEGPGFKFDSRAG